MDVALIVARVLLAGIFLVAGLTKLADRAGSRQALIDFGVPVGLAGSLGLLLPLAELAVALAMIPTATAWWGTLGALALLLVFVAAIGSNLARGRAPRCRCFGQLSASPVGRSTLVRNGVLIGVAGFVVWQGWTDPGPSAVGWLWELTTAERIGLLGGAIVLGGTVFLLLQVMGQQGRLLLRLEALEHALAAGGAPLQSADSAPAPEPAGLPVGTPAPELGLPDLDGTTRRLGDLLAGARALLLLFVDPECGPCTALLPEVGRWQREYADAVRIALIGRGTVEANRAKAAEHGVAPVLLQRDYEAADAYAVFATPSAVLVRADGTIGSPAAGGVEQIRSLVAHAVSTGGAEPWSPPRLLPMADVAVPFHGDDQHHQHPPPAAPPTLQVGELAPPLVLPDLDGVLVDLADIRRSTMVLFWNPDCGFCQQLLPDLLAWEADAPAGAAELLVVSNGSVEANRALGLHAPVVLDEELEVGWSFGANGTPSAVLVDAEGRIASALAVGVPAVQALAGGSRDRAQSASV